MILSLFLSIADALPPRTDPDDAFAEIDSSYALYFFDAVKGTPISNASITFKGQTVSTDRSGKASFSLDNLPTNTQHWKGTFSKSGYIETEFSVKVEGGSIWFNRFSMSPLLELKQLRITLDWMDSPADLDAHLWKKDGFHISYHDMRSYEDLALLDRDDQDGWGAETITISNVDRSGTYTYFVHDYSNRNKPQSKRLSNSRAHIQVFSPEGLLKDFIISADQPGNCWEVFSFKNGSIIINDTVRACGTER